MYGTITGHPTQVVAQHLAYFGISGAELHTAYVLKTAVVVVFQTHKLELTA